MKFYIIWYFKLYTKLYIVYGYVKQPRVEKEQVSQLVDRDDRV